MNKTGKLSLLTSSALILGLTSCSSNNTNENNNSQNNNSSSVYVTTRTISPENETYFLHNENKPETLGSYDYTYGVTMYPPIGEIKPSEEISNTNNSSSNNQPLYTKEEVIQITNNLSSEYDKYLADSINEYETYINGLTTEYNALADEYVNVINSLGDLFVEDTSSPNENTQISTGDNENQIPSENLEENNENPSQKGETNENPSPTFNTREEEVNSLYEQTLKDAANNLDEFEHVQGEPQKIKDKPENNPQIEENPQEFILNAQTIFEEISKGVSLPKYNVKDITYLENNYGISKSNVEDFKLLNFEAPNKNFFEMLIIKTNLSEEDLLGKIQFRLDGILKYISENTSEEIDLSDNVMLVNIGDYTLFCLSNINEALMNFLTSE